MTARMPGNGSVPYPRFRATAQPVAIRTAVINNAGVMPAANRSAMDRPPPAAAENRIRLWEGGTSNATSAAVMLTLTAKSRS